FDGCVFYPVDFWAFTVWGFGNIKEPRRAALTSGKGVSHTSLMPQSVNVTFLLPPSWGQRTRFQNPTLLIQRPGHVFVQDHIRRPTTRCTRRPAMLAITAHPPAPALSWGWS